MQHDILTPRFQVMETGRERLSPELRFPLIVKPTAEGSSKGIGTTSVVDDEDELEKAAAQAEKAASKMEKAAGKAARKMARLSRKGSAGGRSPSATMARAATRPGSRAPTAAARWPSSP